MCGGSVDEGVVVDECASVPTVCTQAFADGIETGAERCVVLFPHVFGYLGGWALVIDLG